MGKLVEIDECRQCRHNLWNSVKFAAWCLKEERLIPKASTIPSWCPLPDAKGCIKWVDE